DEDAGGGDDQIGAESRQQRLRERGGGRALLPECGGDEEETLGALDDDEGAPPKDNRGRQRPGMRQRPRHPCDGRRNAATGSRKSHVALDAAPTMTLGFFQREPKPTLRSVIGVCVAAMVGASSPATTVASMTTT